MENPELEIPFKLMRILIEDEGTHQTPLDICVYIMYKINSFIHSLSNDLLLVSLLKTHSGDRTTNKALKDVELNNMYEYVRKLSKRIVGRRDLRINPSFELECSELVFQYKWMIDIDIREWMEGRSVTWQHLLQYLMDSAVDYIHNWELFYAYFNRKCTPEALRRLAIAKTFFQEQRTLVMQLDLDDNAPAIPVLPVIAPAHGGVGLMLVETLTHLHNRLAALEGATA
jgi:hypothetical protein